MHKFKALIIKDLQINKKSLLIPIWITIGFFILTMIGASISYFSSDLDVNWSDIPSDIPSDTINYILHLAIVGWPGLLCIIFTIMLTQSALNEDIRRNCELFHRSQPVSIWLRSLSKFITGIAGNWVVLLAIVLFHFIVVSIILACFRQLALGAAFVGMFQAYLFYIKTGLIIGSITFFFSAVFKDKAFMQGFAILLGVQFLFMILNALYHWNLPLPLSYLYKLVKTTSMLSFESKATVNEISTMISANWKALIFNWKSLLQIAVSGILFTGATLLYKIKEIK